MPWRNLLTKVLPLDFLHILLSAIQTDKDTILLLMYTQNLKCNCNNS